MPGTVKSDLLNNGVDEPKLFAYPTTTGGQLGNLQWATLLGKWRGETVQKSSVITLSH